MPTPGSADGVPMRREAVSGEPHPVEHFLEVLLIAQDRAVNETKDALREVWLTTIRDIETVLADDTLEVVGARDRLAQRTDPEGRRMYDCACRLLQAHDAADQDAKRAIEKARRG